MAQVKPGSHRWQPLASLALVSVLAACSGAASPSTGSSSTPPQSAAASAAASVASAPASSGPLTLAKPLAPLASTLTVKARLGNSLTTGPFWYAVEEGYFQQLGLNLESVQIQNSSDVVAPLATGQIDIAGTSFDAGLYNAIHRDVNVVAVATNGELEQDLAGSAAVVKKGTVSQYGSDWCSLKGKKVAIVGKTGGLFVTLYKALQSCNLTLNDIDVVSLGFGDMNAAIQNGAVDVAFQVEPYVSSGVAQGLFDVWKPLDQAYLGQQINLLLYGPSFYQNKDAGLRFLVAYLAGARDFHADAVSGGNKTRLGDILSKHLPVKDPSAYSGMIMMGVNPTGQIDTQSVKDSLSILQATGQLPAGNIDLGWIDDNLRQEALTYLPPSGN